jgi:hypothetical protein
MMLFITDTIYKLDPRHTQNKDKVIEKQKGLGREENISPK